MRNLTILLLFSRILVGCDTNTNSTNESSQPEKKPSEKTAENSFYWEVYSSNDLYGYKDSNGFVMIEAQYWTTDYFMNGVAVVETDSGYCLIDYLGTTISAMYDYIESDYGLDQRSTVNYFAEKLFQKPPKRIPTTKSDNEFEEFDRLKEPLDVPEIDEYYEPDTPDKDSVCLIDARGKQISRFYNEISRVENQNYYVAQHIFLEGGFQDKLEVVLDSLGQEISAWYDGIQSAGSVFIVTKKGNDALMNQAGKIITAYYENINSSIYKNEFVVERDFFDKNSTGIMNESGEILIPLKYSEVKWVTRFEFYLTHKMVGSQTYSGLIDSNYHVLYQPVQYIELFPEIELVAISSGTNYAFYKFQEGKLNKASENYQLIMTKYSGTHKFFIFSHEYSGTSIYFTKFTDGLACVKQNNKYGFINDKLETVIPCEYDEILTDFNDGFCSVKKGGEEFEIDKTGKRVTD